MSKGLMAAFLFLTCQTAVALPPFKKAFDDRYVAPTGDKQYIAALKTASCVVCHVKDQPKTMRNAYGNGLAYLIPGNAKKRMEKEPSRVMAQLEAAFTEMEDEKSPSGETYGDLFRSKRLP